MCESPIILPANPKPHISELVEDVAQAVSNYWSDHDGTPPRYPDSMDYGAAETVVKLLKREGMLNPALELLQIT